VYIETEIKKESFQEGSKPSAAVVVLSSLEKLKSKVSSASQAPTLVKRIHRTYTVLLTNAK
jgi:hypothetical protein